MNPSTGRKCVLLTGATGQLGSTLIDLLTPQFDIIALTRGSTNSPPRIVTKVFDPIKNETIHKPIREVSCDLSCVDDIVSIVSTISSLVPRIDHVINAAGDIRFLGSTTDAQFISAEAKNQFQMHVFAPAIICSVLFHSQWKHISLSEMNVSIINISSLSAMQLFSGSGQGFYAASKSAENMLTVHMAAEYGKYGIRVNAICPNGFPAIISTRSVAETIISIMKSEVTGQVYKLDTKS